MSQRPFDKADVLIPNLENMEKWSVVACDQYTSEPEYWERVANTVGDSPSALKIILPEVYLERDGVEEKINNINATMDKYIEDKLFCEYKNSFIYLERTLRDGGVRKGLMGVVDLEAYDYNVGSQSLIRATEGTVLDRLPPRVKVRENASLELPHIMLLIDDSEDTVFGCIDKNNLKKVYDLKLMENSGASQGYLVDDATADSITKAIDKLGELDEFNKKYNVTDKGVLQFAVGDGNHSLATAKQCYENLKKTMSEEEYKNHPARYALVELVNLHDDTLSFEAIHRVVFDIDREKLLNSLYDYYDISETEADGQMITVVYDETKKNIWIKNPSANLAVGSLQKFLDEYLAKNGGKVDYIHGEDVTVDLASQSKNNIGFLLPTMSKDELFKTVILDGALPRKTFSMGHACDKRFYLETRKIKNNY